MQQTDWAHCPAAIRAQVDALVNGLRFALDGNLLGVYLHGSLAMGCFNPDLSDIDVLVVTADEQTPPQKRVLAELLLAVSAQPRPIEISVMHSGQLHPFVHPAPFEFHFGESWRERFATALVSPGWAEALQPGTDPDLAAHIAVTRARGLALLGAPPADVFPIVPRETLLDAILQDTSSVEYGVGGLPAMANPANAILNACRAFAYLREERLLSKDEGALWAVLELPWRYGSLAARALEWYRSGAVPVFEIDELVRFKSYVRAELAVLTGVRYL